jgi:hypothetical protein
MKPGIHAVAIGLRNDLGDKPSRSLDLCNLILYSRGIDVL